MMDLISGRIPEVMVELRERPIPPELLQADYEGDSASRVLFQRWLNTLWAEKDCVMTAWLSPAGPAPGAQSAAPPG
jgi:hypothetical protein